MAKVLVFGLPGSGKSYLSERVVSYLGDNAVWINADRVREEANDWDFSEEGRNRQFNRMKDLADKVDAEGKIAICDFVCPFSSNRQKFGADCTIFVDTIEEGRFEDTNKAFERPRQLDEDIDYHITQKDEQASKDVAWYLGSRFVWDDNAPTTQMLGRFQPWPDGHQALFERALAKHGQVYIMIRNMPVTDSNPFPATEVVQNVRNHLTNFAGRVKIVTVPNIMNITYGRDVGYKIEQEVFDDTIHSISATKIREQMRKEGKL